MDGAAGDARGVIDGDVDELPAGAFRAPQLAIAGGAIAWYPEAAELLDIQMQQVAGVGMFVALHRGRRLEFAQAVQSAPAQDASEGAVADAQGLTDVAVGVTALALLDHLLDPFGDRAWGIGEGARSGSAARRRLPLDSA